MRKVLLVEVRSLKTLLHIEKIAALSSQNSREKVQFFNFDLNPPCIRHSIDGRKLLSVL
jgi:hypothetical protein